MKDCPFRAVLSLCHAGGVMRIRLGYLGYRLDFDLWPFMLHIGPIE